MVEPSRGLHVLLGQPVTRVVVGVAVTAAVGPEGIGDGLKVPTLDGAHGPVDGEVGAVALGGGRQVENGLGEYPGYLVSTHPSYY